MDNIGPFTLLGSEGGRRQAINIATIAWIDFESDCDPMDAVVHFNAGATLKVPNEDARWLAEIIESNRLPIPS